MVDGVVTPSEGSNKSPWPCRFNSTSGILFGHRDLTAVVLCREGRKALLTWRFGHRSFSFSPSLRSTGTLHLWPGTIRNECRLSTLCIREKNKNVGEELPSASSEALTSVDVRSGTSSGGNRVLARLGVRAPPFFARGGVQLVRTHGPRRRLPVSYVLENKEDTRSLIHNCAASWKRPAAAISPGKCIVNVSVETTVV